MIANEIFNLTIDRSLFEARGEQTLRGLCYIRKGEWEHDKKEYIANLKDIIINGVEIQGDSISLSTRYVKVGFLNEYEQIVNEDGKKNKYKSLKLQKTAEIAEVKKISFKQEIGTSKKWMGVNIYIKDTYSKIKEEMKEIRG